MNIENENGFIFYESEDENSGEFTYLPFLPTRWRAPIILSSAMRRM